MSYKKWKQRLPRSKPHASKQSIAPDELVVERGQDMQPK
jgi:hypothetical protein